MMGDTDKQPVSEAEATLQAINEARELHQSQGRNPENCVVSLWSLTKRVKQIMDGQ